MCVCTHVVHWFCLKWFDVCRRLWIGGRVRWSAAAALRRSGAAGSHVSEQVLRRGFLLQPAIAYILSVCVCSQQFDVRVHARECPVRAPARPPRQPTMSALCGLYVVCEGPFFCCRSVMICLTTVFVCLQSNPMHSLLVRAVTVLHFPIMCTGAACNRHS